MSVMVIWSSCLGELVHLTGESWILFLGESTFVTLLRNPIRFSENQTRDLLICYRENGSESQRIRSQRIKFSHGRVINWEPLNEIHMKLNRAYITKLNIIIDSLRKIKMWHSWSEIKCQRITIYNKSYIKWPIYDLSFISEGFWGFISSHPKIAKELSYSRSLVLSNS